MADSWNDNRPILNDDAGRPRREDNAEAPSMFTIVCRLRVNTVAISPYGGHTEGHRVRRKLDISQEELSLRSGFGRAYLSGLERGRRNPTVVTVSELALALEATVHDLTCHGPADGVATPDEDGGSGSAPRSRPRRRRTRRERP